MKMGSSQQYCLRWNNHRSNLLTVFDQLLQNEAFTDVTLACDGGASVKCHKMVLAACSPYFQCLFTELPCRHPVVVLKDVKYNDMKAILEYMYRGEVNVAHDQLGALLKVAEVLKVKGLVEENGREPTNSLPLGGLKREQDRSDMSSPPRIGTSSTSISSVPHSSVSPPHSTHGNGDNCPSNSYSKSPYLYGKSPVMDRSGRMNLPLWAVPLPHHPAPVPPPNHPHSAATAAAAMLSCYEAASSDMSPLKRKKLQSLLMSRDTPILRTVLGQGQSQGQGQVDSSQPVPLVCHPDTQERIQFNGSVQDSERNVKAEPSEDAPSPCTDISMMEEENSPNDKKGALSSSPQTAFTSDMRGVSSGIATYVPQQKPEWKRYKQYTRNDILSAIEAVRTGMSALQAARKYGVPSRTLYDKVKKLGITTSRPFKRGSNGGNSNSFPYGMSGGLGHMFGGGAEPDEPIPPHPGGGLLEPMFLQHALERSKGDFTEREALMALAAHAQTSAGSGSGSRHSGSNHNSSPENNGRSPSPNMISMKYMRHGSMTPSPNDEDRLEDEDQVEDLSVTRKEVHPPPTGSVIVPPMSLLAKKAEELAELSRERERERARMRERDSERESEMERERDRDRERVRDIDSDREMERDRDRERERERERERDRERDRLQDEAGNHSSDDSRRE